MVLVEGPLDQHNQKSIGSMLAIQARNPLVFAIRTAMLSWSPIKRQMVGMFPKLWVQQRRVLISKSQKRTSANWIKNHTWWILR